MNPLSFKRKIFITPPGSCYLHGLVNPCGEFLSRQELPEILKGCEK
jgi:hypothetical protein